MFLVKEYIKESRQDTLCWKGIFGTKICNRDPGEIRDFPSLGIPFKYFCIIFQILMRVKLDVTSPRDSEVLRCGWLGLSSLVQRVPSRFTGDDFPLSLFESLGIETPIIIL